MAIIHLLTPSFALGEYYSRRRPTRLSCSFNKYFVTYLVKKKTIIAMGRLLEWMIVLCFMGRPVHLKGYYVDNGMGQSVAEFLSHEEQSLMQEEILGLLGLSHVPQQGRRRSHTSAGINHTVSLFMRDLYESLQSSSEGLSNNRFQLDPGILSDVRESDVIMSFGNHGRQEDGEWTRLFWFDTNELPRNPQSQVITSSLLRLYKGKGKGGNGLIKVFQLVEKGGEAIFLDSILVSSGESRWISLDVTHALAAWQSDVKSNQGLMVQILDAANDTQLRPESFGIVGSRHSLPMEEGFMVAFLKQTEDPIQRSHRVKRSFKIIEDGGDTTHHKKKNKKNRRKYSYLEDDFISEDVYRDFYGGDTRSRACQKRSLFVSFKDLGWQDWIIAPEGYAAFYCHGECTFPLNVFMNATNHAIVQTLVNIMQANIPKPCCAPVQLSGISVLYFDESTNVILKKFRNMVVKTCGCH